MLRQTISYTPVYVTSFNKVTVHKQRLRDFNRMHGTKTQELKVA